MYYLEALFLWKVSTLPWDRKLSDPKSRSFRDDERQVASVSKHKAVDPCLEREVTLA
jgi:hypothetical protein